MKKYLVLLIVSLFFTAVLFSESTITVDHPAQGEPWQAGSSPYIKWTKNGPQDALVKIKLFNFNMSDKVLDIDDNIGNNGSYKWDIPATLNPGNYVIRVKTMDNAVTGNSKVFIITGSGTSNPPGDDPGQSSGNVVAKSNKNPKMIKYFVKVTKPKINDIYMEGHPLNIRWKSNYPGAWKVSLVREDKTKSVVLSGPMQHLGEQHQMMVDIPKGLSGYPFRKFKVRVGTPSPFSKIVGFSKVFNIRAPQSKISYAEYPSEKQNCSKKKIVTYEWMGNLNESGTGSTYKKIPGRVRVGYEHLYKEDGAEWFYKGHIYRGWIKFDLSKLEGIPGYVTKAILHVYKAENEVHPGLLAKTCCNRLFRLDSPFSGNACYSGAAEQIAVIPHKDGKSHWEVDIKTTVRNWITNPNTNNGILLIPYKEDYEHSNYYCVTYYKTRLIVEYVESKK